MGLGKKTKVEGHLDVHKRLMFLMDAITKRYNVHLLYGSPQQRGRTSVIEDLPVLTDVHDIDDIAPAAAVVDVAAAVSLTVAACYCNCFARGRQARMRFVALSLLWLSYRRRTHVAIYTFRAAFAH